MKIFKKVFWFVLIVSALFIVPTASAQGAEPPIPIGEITVATLGAIIQALLSLALDYAPWGFAAWWNGLEVATKQRWMVLSAFVIVGILVGLTCLNVITTNLICTRAGIFDTITSVLYVYAIGQGFHAGTKPTAEFKFRVLKFPTDS